MITPKSIISVFAVFSILFSTEIQAQHFDWASSGSGMLTGMSHAIITKQGKLITGMQYDQPSYYPMNQMPVIYSANGDSIAFGMIQSQMIVFGYDTKGNIEWTLRGDRFASNTELLGIASTKNGNTIIAHRAYEMAGDIKILPMPAELMDDDERVNPEITDEMIDYNGRSSYTTDAAVFTEIGNRGYVIKSIAIKGIDRDSWVDFKSTPDGGYIIAFEKRIKTKDVHGQLRDVAHHITLKLDENFNSVWVHKVMYLDDTCCSTFIPSIAMTISDAGEVYIAGNIRLGMRVQGDKDHMAPIIDEVTQYNKPYDSYVAKLDKNGKLLWVKYTKSKTIIEDIAVDKGNVYFCGVNRVGGKIIDMKSDTTDQKYAFLACLDLNGKSKWVKTFRASTVKTLDTDQLGNVNVLFQSKSTQYDKPLIIGKDTLTNSYADLIVSSFNGKGEARWMKSSNVMMSDGTESFPILLHDDCGNIYVIGSMWYVLPVSFSVFDAALVRGVGYGGAPLVAKIRTTLKPESESLNPELHTAIDPVINSGNDEDNEHGNCIAIPAPLKLEVFPNPTNGKFMARATFPYADKNVKLELFNNSGSSVSVISVQDLVQKGIHEYPCDLSHVAGGQYILVLRGASSAVSTRVMITK